MKDSLHAIYARGSLANTFDTAISIGGVDYTSGTLSYDVAHFSGGALLVNIGGGTNTIQGNVIASQSGSWTATVFGTARTTDPAAAANGATTPIITDSLGKVVVLPGSVNDLHLDGQVALAGVLATAVIPAVAAGRRIAMQSILVTNSGSQTVQIIISGGPNNRTFGHAFPGGGFQLQAGGAALYITSASTALSVAGDVTATCNVFVSGYSLSN